MLFCTSESIYNFAGRQMSFLKGGFIPGISWAEPVDEKLYKLTIKTVIKTRYLIAII
jgi:hypothetical protein